MVYLFLPKGSAAVGRGLPIDGRMFFLGAAFMLLETRAVVQLALLFGKPGGGVELVRATASGLERAHASTTLWGERASA